MVVTEARLAPAPTGGLTVVGRAEAVYSTRPSSRSTKCHPQAGLASAAPSAAMDQGGGLGRRVGLSGSDIIREEQQPSEAPRPPYRQTGCEWLARRTHGLAPLKKGAIKKQNSGKGNIFSQFIEINIRM